MRAVGCRRRVVVILFLVSLVSGGTCFAQQVPGVSPKGTKFFIYTPPGYPSDGPHPLLIVLPGQGGMGDDLNVLLRHKDQIPAKLIAQGKWPSEYPFIVVTPQLKRDESVPDPKDQLWPPELVDEVVDHIRSQYDVDDSRIYITGLSLGAHGSYSYAAAYPEKIAALVMVSGVPDTTVACNIKDIAVWAFHGSDDWLVPLEFPEGMVRNVNACAPRGQYIPHLSMMYARRHDGWSEIYNETSGYRIYDWMLKFRKNSKDNTPPYVNAGSDRTITDTDGFFHIFADAFDSDGQIRQLVWRQTSGPSVDTDQITTPFLKISDPSPGIFEFEVTVTDDDGARASDRVKITVTGQPELPATMSLTLMDARNQSDVVSLYDGYVINPKTLRQINIRAASNGNTGSIRFSVNGNENTRTDDEAPYELSTPRWTLEEGAYLVCATPYTQSNGEGSRGTSLCYRIVVSTDATAPPPPPPTEKPKHFFAKNGHDISTLASWSSTPEGTGSAPDSFNGDGQTFDIATDATLDGPLTIKGEGSVLRIRDQGELSVNSALLSPVIMEAGAAMHVNTNATVTLGSLDPESTVTFTANATIPAADFGNLTLDGPGTKKTLSTGITRIKGTLVVRNDVSLQGAGDAGSTLALSQDADILPSESLRPTVPFGLVFDGKGNQRLHLACSEAWFHQISLDANTTVNVSGPIKRLEVGSDYGGGLILTDGAELMLADRTLTIAGKGTINRGNEKGKMAVEQSKLIFNSSASYNSYLYFTEGLNSISELIINLAGTGKLMVMSPLHVTSALNTVDGVVESNGFLTLVSDGRGTAQVFGSGGKVNGDVVVQRFIEKGKAVRLLSFPVSSVSVAELQGSIPVTGQFDGASAGGGLNNEPSLHYYDEPSGGWVPFPAVSHLEELTPGRGYRVFIHNDKVSRTLIMSGLLHHGAFNFTLTGNKDNDAAKGWNLVGNPYTSAIDWNSISWSRMGVSPVVYVFDSSYQGGRFLIWDGDVGDPEFGGLIQQGQAFFVRATNAAPAMAITEETKSDSMASLWRTKQITRDFSYLEITLRQGGLVDRTWLKFSDAGEFDFDPSDGVKRTNSYFSLSSLSRDSVSLAINHLRQTFCDQVVTLNAEAPEGSYALSFDGTREDEINLVDAYTNKSVTVQKGTLYTFKITNDPKSFATGRFRIEMPSGTLPEPEVTFAGSTLSSNVSSGNQWLLNGEEIEGATGQTLVPVLAGEYSVRVTAGGCSRTSASVLVEVPVTAIGEVPGEVMIYPNPASNVLIIKIPGAQNTDASYTIMNGLGQQVIQGKCHGAGTEIDLREFAPGIYYLHLNSSQWTHRVRFAVDPR